MWGVGVGGEEGVPLRISIVNFLKVTNLDGI
jgi:hypothetical protein